MKVLQIVKTNVGASWAFNQSKWLIENGIDIVTVLPSINGGMAEKYKKLGMEIVESDFSLPITKPWKLLSRNKEVNKIVKDIQPDLIHCHFVTNIMMLRIALRKSTIPRLFQVPGPLHLENFIFRHGEIMISNRFDYWAGSCKRTCGIYKDSGISENRIFLSYYGIYKSNIDRKYMESRGILHKEYNLSEDKILVGMVSYFYKPKKYLFQSRGLKGHEDFIDAIAISRQKNPHIIGIIIGDGWGNAKVYVNKIKRYADKKCKDGIVFTGFRRDMNLIYKELDIAVHPSHSENLGGAGESLAAGVPTISTNIGGFPDIVVDEETGYTVQAKSPRCLADAIIKMIEKPIKAKKMSEKGMQKVKQLLDGENTGSSVLNIYNKIIDWNKEL